MQFCLDSNHKLCHIGTCLTIRSHSPGGATFPASWHSQRKQRRSTKIDKYDGSFCVEIFSNKFEDNAGYNVWDETDKLVHLKASLTGSATYLLTESRGLTYEDMKEKLRRRYSTREQQERFKVELKIRLSTLCLKKNSHL